MMRRAVVLCLGLLASPVVAQEDPASAALRAKGLLEEAAVALDHAQGARDRVAALTQTVKAYEAGLAALRTGLRQAAIREKALTQELNSAQGQVADLLASLLTIGRSPAPVQLTHPDGPTGTARAGMILSEVSPALQAEADTLARDLDEVKTLRALQQTAADTLREGLRGAQEARTALSAAISDRTDLPTKFTADPVKTAVLVASSESLGSFADNLGQIVAGEELEGGPDVHEQRGMLELPVQGTILRAAGQPDAAGIVRPGWVIATAPGALVTTPAAATIRYLGPLLDYGNVMIIEPGPGILFVLAGMEQVYGEVGQVLPAGHPLGMMHGAGVAQGEILTQADTGQNTETLYLEVRENQEPVDPDEWFKTDKE
ncbi:peptidoglycan DD-metalloendopeptidase family protein [Donghicola sp. C2-DW-16]|uniref:Peptidoglycan DD-metalloendopeptidase family protein n=1 Tax=Donghicola mangrovi TaxID=2729614 RepID=A0ABX2PI65_9RHOB|nr:peptidoglycan DD-metalloendopeptidase family protein [Donghicola mangrovi]NVO28687.1 peptidoglycan DD-metalloendopeptidase family protein [Donghicola mangrovi]